MAWSDYFEPDFCDPDSPSYAGDNYLPVFGEENRGKPGFCGDLWEESGKNPVWDFRDAVQTVKAMRTPFSMYNKMREYAVEIDNNDTLWTLHNNKEATHNVDVTKETKYKEEKVFNFGKYKGRKISEIEILDPNYIKWCRENISWFNL